MKYLTVVFALLGVSAALAQEQTSPPPAKVVPKKKPPVKAAVPVAPLTIPADAVLNPEGNYSYTDKTGKKWIYNKTPFGISKTEGPTVEASGLVSASKDQSIKTTIAGDTVKFERQTPFGTTKWEKKKSDMTDEERGIFQSQHPESQQNQPQ